MNAKICNTKNGIVIRVTEGGRIIRDFSPSAFGLSIEETLSKSREELIKLVQNKLKKEN